MLFQKKEGLTIEEFETRHRKQRTLTAEYLQGKIELQTYKLEMDKVATPLNLRKLAQELNFPGKNS